MRNWFRNRKYKSGTGWCLWKWSDVDSEYILRLHLVKTPFFAVCLHWINKPDPEPYLHDHPVTFLSLILRGWYREKRWGRNLYTERQLQFGADRPLKIRHNWLNWIRASFNDRHTICEVSQGGALTLCLMGPKTREWGFHTPDGWVGWKDYYAKQRAEKVKRG